VKQSAKYKSRCIRSDVVQGGIWDVHRITEVWHCESATAGTPLLPSVDGMNILADTSTGGPVLPNIGDAYTIPGGTGTKWVETALLRSINWAKSSIGLNATLEYTTRYFQTNASGDARGLAKTEEVFANATNLAAGLFLPAQVVPVMRTRSAKLLRDNPGMTGPPVASDKSGADIGGIAKQCDTDVCQVGMRLRIIIDSESQSIDATTGVLQQYVGKRNLNAFLGYGAQNLVCTSASLNHLEDEYWEVVLEYLFDQYYHHSQEAQRGTDGRPLMSGTNFANVQWVRANRSEVDFNDIWPVGDLGKSLKYQCFAGRWW
jgi:hypothetical protein